MKAEVALNKFLPMGETNITIQGFLYKKAGARKSKYAVVCHNRGEVLVLFTFASSYKAAFRIAKSAYEASSYPKVDVGHFVVYGICQSTICHCGGEWRTKSFAVDWGHSS